MTSIDAPRLAPNHPVSHRGRLVVLLTPEFEGVHPNSGNLGRLSRDLANWGKEHGLRYLVVVPYSRELDDVPWQKTSTGLFFNFNYGRFDGIPVFAVGKEVPFSQRFPQGDSALREISEFGRAFFFLASGQRIYTNPAAVIHALDYSMGIAVASSNVPIDPFKICFSPIDPQLFDVHFPITDPALATALSVLPFMDGVVSSAGVSGLEVGARQAHSVLFWSSKFHAALAGDPNFRSFMIKAEGKSQILPGSWDPRLPESIPETTLRGIEEAYMRMLYNEGVKRSLHFIQNPDLTIDRAIILVSEPTNPNQPSRTQAVDKAVADASSGLQKLLKHGVTVLGSGRNGVFNNYWQNAGALVTLLETVIKDPQLNRRGRYVIIPDGGYFERGGPLTHAVGMEGVKGLTPDGKYTLNINCIRQAPALFHQLPQHGYGWIVFCASDNRFVPDGTLKAGGKNLWEVPQGLVITGQPERVSPDLTNEQLDHVRSLGWWITDSNGAVTVFAEKTPIDLVRRVVDRSGGEEILKNTFVFAMTIPVAEKIIEKLMNTPCLKDQQPYVTTYPLDISSHIFFPMTVSKKDWMQIFALMSKIRAAGDKSLTSDEKSLLTTTGLSVFEVAKGMLKFESPKAGVIFDHEQDWLNLWNFADDISKTANGLAGANMGHNSIWDDFGTLLSINAKWRRYLESKDDVRTAARTFGDITLNSNGENVGGLHNVTFIDPHTGGRFSTDKIEHIPKDVLLVNVEFKHPIEIVARKVVIYNAQLGEGVKRIPADTVIRGGVIKSMEEAPDQPADTKDQPRLLVNCYAEKVVLYGGMLHTSLSLRFADHVDLHRNNLDSNDTPVALMPIGVNLKEPLPDSWANHPALKGINRKKALIDQPFIIEDASGNPVRTDLDFWQVRGGY